MSRRLPLALVLLAASAASASAQGTGVFARMGMGARSLALPSQLADRSGLASPYLNPALAPFQPAQGVELSAGLLTFDRTWEAIQVAAPLRPRSGFAAGVVHGGVDNIDGRDASGQPIDAPTADGTYATDEYAFFVTFGTQLSDAVSAGVGFRLYRTDLFAGVQAPTAIGVSAGVSARLSPRLSAGLIVDDLFARYEYSSAGSVSASATDYFPIRLRGGPAYAFGARTDGRPRALVAAEVELALQPAETTRPSGVQVIGTAPVARDTTLDLRLAETQGPDRRRGLVDGRVRRTRRARPDRPDGRRAPALGRVRAPAAADGARHSRRLRRRPGAVRDRRDAHGDGPPRPLTVCPRDWRSR